MAIINLSDIPEIKAVEAGEYDVRIIKAFTKTYDSGSKAVNFVIEIVGEENADEFFHSIWLPTAADSEKKTANKLRMLVDFLTALGLPTDEFDDENLEMFIDVEFAAYLEQEADYKDDTKMKNVIKRIL